MKREILARKLGACNTHAQLLDQVEALIREEREVVLAQAIQNLDRRQVKALKTNTTPAWRISHQ